MQQMTVACISAPKQVSLQTRPLPQLTQGQALIQVQFCGLSGTCLRSYRGDFPGTIYPAIPGLEIVGTVYSAQPGPLQEGQRVVIEPFLSCGTCQACLRQRYNCCASLRLLGVHMPGGMSEFVLAPLERIHPLPEELDSLPAVMCEPFAIGMQAATRMRISSGENVVVLGCGVIGLTILLIARSQGARVLVVEPNPTRRAFAARLGADAVSGGDTGTVKEFVLDQCHGKAADVVIDASGNASAIASITSIVASAGRVGLVGINDEKIPLSVLEIVRKELDICGIRNCCGLFPQAIRFVQEHQATVKQMLDHLWPLSQVAEAFHYTDLHASEMFRTVLQVGQS